MKNLKITKDRFLDFFYNSGQDQEMEELKNDLAQKVINGLYSNKGTFTIAVEDIFNECNQDSIRLSFCDGYSEDECGEDNYDIELGDIEEGYTIKLVD